MAAHSAAAFWYGMAQTKNKPKIMEGVGKRLAQRYSVYVETLKDVAGVENLPPDQRLDAYQQRSPQVWRLLEKVWPEQKAKQSADWQNLETSSLNKRLVQHLTRDRIDPATRA